MDSHCIGVVAVNEITAVGVFYIAWLGVALKSYGSAWEHEREHNKQHNNYVI